MKEKRLLRVFMLACMLLCATALHAQEPYAVLSDDDTVLTFYYDMQKGERNGMSVGPFEIDENWQLTTSWNPQRETITTVVFDASFADCTSLTSTAWWFYGCNNLTTIKGIENLKTDNVTDMKGMFNFCSGLTSLDVSGFKTDNVTNMNFIFSGCSGLTSLDLSGFNTENVTNMIYMFQSCKSLTSLDLSGFKTDNVTDMSGMFRNCESLTSLDVSGFKTDNVTNMFQMFYGCSGLTSLDLSSFNTDNVTDMRSMFQECFGLTTIYASDGWSTENVQDGYGGYSMFLWCTNLVGGQGTAYDENHTDHEYARIDKPGQPGYLTWKKGAPVDITPVLAGTTINMGGLGDEDLTDNVVDGIYYNLGGEDNGYDAVDGSIVISDATDMSLMTDATPGSADVTDNFTGIILKVAKGEGSVTVSVKTEDNARLAVQTGNGTPTTASRTEKGNVAVNYDVAEDTYIYIYSVAGSSAASARRAAPAGVVRIYAITVGNADTGIAELRSASAGSGAVYDFQGRRLSGSRTAQGIYIKDGRKVVVK